MFDYRAFFLWTFVFMAGRNYTHSYSETFRIYTDGACLSVFSPQVSSDAGVYACFSYARLLRRTEFAWVQREIAWAIDGVGRRHSAQAYARPDTHKSE